MYVADDSHVGGRISVQLDVVLPKMHCSCMLSHSSQSLFVSTAISELYTCVLSFLPSVL